ncbi:MAG: HupE/UreJ family protein [Cyanobacteria bacterium CRU_2_1]|nr:HupE/UreJ family protein [Cyanobacteria bacterium RU_5_0]NJR60800.1 HupE/UreJ family protein [Cyanobacteria bacterium CRU_2_1]
MKSQPTFASFYSTIVGLLGGSLLAAMPAIAHHAFGEAIPRNGFEGFLSGLAHPIIGFDHFAFVVAIGLLAATKRQGIWLPIAFLFAALAGAGIHLLSYDLPAPEVFISASVLIFGVMLTMQGSLNLLIMIGLGAIAGLFHGYAYGEAIVGAEMTPLVAYLAGFTAIQLGVATIAFVVGRLILKQPDAIGFRYVGLILCGVGAAFLSSAIFG